MPTAEQILTIARAEIGTKENPPNSNKQKYGVAYGMNGVPWCMIFVYWCFQQADATSLFPLKTASCSSFMQASRQAGTWVTSGYKAGDVLIYNFGTSKKPVYHTGICESTSGSTVTAIEGNTGINNNANGGQVMRKKRNITFVKGAVRPKYDAQKPLPLVAQEVIDGVWGNGDARVQRLQAAGYNPADVLNIRAAPDLYAKKLDIFGAGVFATIEEVRAGKGASAWGRVGNGWISLDYVREV